MSRNDQQQLFSFFMRLAIQLGEKGRLTAPPNPWVGCVIVKEGELLGKGYHCAPGEPHAEVVALEQAGPLARGATAFVSLEPCAHHGRTPPCTEALIESGVKRVVIPLLDPDTQVAGQGVKRLEEAGIEVLVGVAELEATRSLLPYLHHRRTQTPYVVLKSAMSLDGKIAASDGSSKWITSEEARADVQRLRAESQAILIGSETARLDQPRLTVRDLPASQPLRVVIDRRGRLSREGPLFDLKLGPTLVFTGQEVTLESVLQELGKRGVMQLLVEGGSELHAAFLREKRAHKLSLYVGNCLLGEKGRALAPGFEVLSIDRAPRFELDEVRRFGQSVRLDYLLASDAESLAKSSGV